MLKKYALIVASGLITILALSGFSSLGKPAAVISTRLSLSIGVTGFQTPLLSDFVPSIAVTGFRTPLMSDFVPSIAVTGFRTPLMSDFVPSNGDTNFRIAHTYNGIFIPSMSVTGVIPEVFRQYEYGPASLATGSAAVSVAPRMVPLSEIFSEKAVPSTKISGKTGLLVVPPATKDSVIASSLPSGWLASVVTLEKVKFSIP